NSGLASGGANGRLFMDRLGRLVQDTARVGAAGAVMLVHLARFEKIAQAFGLGIGDSLLKGVAMRLDLGLRASWARTDGGDKTSLPAIYKLGDDEFAVLLAGVSRGADLAPIAQSLLAAMAAPFRPAGQAGLS